jgi:TRAP-type uncharacterized transport system fused permease subunit
MFAYNPSLLFQGPLLRVGLSTLTAVLGVVALAAAVQAFFRRKLNTAERILFAVVAIALIKPGIKSDILGIVFLSIMYFLQRKIIKPNKERSESENAVEND